MNATTNDQKKNIKKSQPKRQSTRAPNKIFNVAGKFSSASFAVRKRKKQSKSKILLNYTFARQTPFESLHRHRWITQIFNSAQTARTQLILCKEIQFST